MIKAVSRILDRTQKKFRFDVRYFLKAGFWLNVNQAVNILCTFLLSLLFANVLEKRVYGMYAFIAGVLKFCGVFSTPGLRFAVLQGVGKGKDGTYKAVLKRTMLSSILGSIFLFGTAVYMYIHQNVPWWIFVALALLYPLWAPSGYFARFLQAKQLNKTFAILNTSFTVVHTVLLAVAIFVTQSAIIMIVVSVATQLSIKGYLSFRYVKKYIRNTDVSKKDIVYGNKVNITSIFTDLTSLLGPIIVPALGGLATLAEYVIANQVAESVINLLRTTTNSFIPRLAKTTSTTLKDIKRFYLILLGVALVGFIGFNIVIEPLFALVYPQYMNSVLYARGFSLLIFVLPSSIISSYLSVHHAASMQIGLTFAGRAAYFAILLIGIPLLGVWGVLWAQVGSKLLTSIVLTGYLFIYKM